MGRNDAHLRISAGGKPGIRNTVSDRNLAHPFAESFDYSRSLHSDYRRQMGQRIEAGPVIDIYEIHPYGFVADKRFTMTGHPRIVFLETQDFGSPCR
jgi:hypothetical protein